MQINKGNVQKILLYPTDFLRDWNPFSSSEMMQ